MQVGEAFAAFVCSWDGGVFVRLSGVEAFELGMVACSRVVVTCFLTLLYDAIWET